MSKASPDDDDWGPGLRFKLKTLNTKKVRRAKCPSEVLLVCLRHNLRKENHDHRTRHPIDPAKTVNNTVLIGSTEPSVCAELANNILDELGLSPKRMDAIMGIEYVFQPPPGWDVPLFYEVCLGWVKGRFEYVLSAVVHRDQPLRPPHLHVLVLAVADEKLDGGAMTSGSNGRDAQRIDFMNHMRAATGLRPDREPKPARKLKSMAETFIGAGKGPKTRAAAAKSDAKLMRRAGEGEADLYAHQPLCPTDLNAQADAPTSYWARLAVAKSLFDACLSAGTFPRTAARPLVPAPKPAADGSISPVTGPTAGLRDGNVAALSATAPPEAPHSAGNVVDFDFRRTGTRT